MELQRQCVTAHLTLHCQQVTSVGRRAVHGRVANPDEHHTHPVARQAVHNKPDVAKLCNISRSHQLIARQRRGLPDLA